MRLWTMSDLHLESTRGWDLPTGNARPDFDVLVVAGDVIPRMERGVRWLAARVPDRPVIYVAGNHEPYGQDLDLDLEKALAAADGTNIHVLQDAAVTIDSVTFYGTTLWTDFDLFEDPQYAMDIAAAVMNDYRKIRSNNYQRRLRPAETLLRHANSRGFLKRELGKPRSPGERRVVVSHHGGHRDAIRRGSEREIASAAYVSDLSPLISEGAPELWIYGHTHERRDFMVGDTRMVTNSKGYGPWRTGDTWENPGFDPTLIIEI